MALFQTSEEFGNLMLGFMNKLMETPEIAEKLVSTKMSVRYNYTDPDYVLYVDLTSGVIDDVVIAPGDTDSKADLELSMTADIAHRNWSGKLNPMMALTTKKVQAKGAVGKALKLQPAMKKAYALYNKYIEENEEYNKYMI